MQCKSKFLAISLQNHNYLLASSIFADFVQKIMLEIPAICTFIYICLYVRKKSNSLLRFELYSSCGFHIGEIGKVY